MLPNIQFFDSICELIHQGIHISAVRYVDCQILLSDSSDWYSYILSTLAPNIGFKTDQVRFKLDYDGSIELRAKSWIGLSEVEISNLF